MRTAIITYLLDGEEREFRAIVEPCGDTERELRERLAWWIGAAVFVRWVWEGEEQ